MSATDVAPRDRVLTLHDVLHIVEPTSPSPTVSLST